jgi:hypothetical protein
MTATETMAAPTTTDTWTAEMAQLRSRYKTVREPILAALNLLLQDANITDDDAKARAAMRGIRITAASINGARNLLLKAGDVQATTATPTTPATPTSTAAAPQRAARRARPAEGSVDAEALIRQVVGKIQGQGNAEAERLRETIRKAVAMLSTAVG